MSEEELVAARRFEEEWDPVLGGPATRPYRELAAFCMGRLLLLGADLNEVLVYFQAALQQHAPQPRAPGSSS